jgi:hypothetical protein
LGSLYGHAQADHVYAASRSAAIEDVHVLILRCEPDFPDTGSSPVVGVRG